MLEILAYIALGLALLPALAFVVLQRTPAKRMFAASVG
jgi:hypothetical protein